VIEMKRIITIALLAALAFSMAGCTNGEPPTEEEAPVEFPVEETVPEYITPSRYFQRPARLREYAVRPSDEELLQESFWLDRHNHHPSHLLLFDSRHCRDNKWDIQTRTMNDFIFSRRRGMNDFVYWQLDFQGVYIHAGTSGLVFPPRRHYMPIEEYIYWAVRLYGGTADEWREYLTGLTWPRIVVDKDTLVAAARLTAEETAHWPQGQYIAIEAEQTVSALIAAPR